MIEKAIKVRSPEVPRYFPVREVLRILSGVRKAAVDDLVNSIGRRTGTPQSTVAWSKPDEWIKIRLSGATAELATCLWRESEGLVNPRYLHELLRFINTHRLLEVDNRGIYRPTRRGQAFLDNDPATMRLIDEAEAMPQLLAILGRKDRAKRGDLLPEWHDFLQAYSNLASEKVVYDALTSRLNNLIERGFVREEKKNVYVITGAGREYAAM